VDPKAGKTSLADYANRWAGDQAWRPSTRARVVSILKRQILPAFGNRQLASLRRGEIQAWTRTLADSLQPTTVEGTYRLLAAILRAAVHDRLIAVSPADGVRLPRREGVMVTPLTVAEVETLADAIRPDLRIAVLVAALTGVRQGELFGLTEDRVRWLRRELVIDRQLLTEKGGLRLGPTKMARSVRTVPLTDRALELLSDQIRLSEQLTVLYSTRMASLGVATVRPGRCGRPGSPYSWTRAGTRCGITLPPY
jgi:integrase